MNISTNRELVTVRNCNIDESRRLLEEGMNLEENLIGVLLVKDLLRLEVLHELSDEFGRDAMILGELRTHISVLDVRASQVLNVDLINRRFLQLVHRYSLLECYASIDLVAFFVLVLGVSVVRAYFNHEFVVFQR